MPQSISDIIYQAFFEKVSSHKEVKTKTIEALKKLIGTNQITDKQSMARFSQEVESRYAQNKKTDCK